MIHDTQVCRCHALSPVQNDTMKNENDALSTNPSIFDLRSSIIRESVVSGVVFGGFPRDHVRTGKRVAGLAELGVVAESQSPVR